MKRVADALAIVLFATIGQLSHHGGVSAAGYAEVALPLIAGWLAASYAFRGRLGLTWLAGTTVGIAIRMVALSHYRASEAAFWLVALAFLGAAAGSWRLALALVERRRARPLACPRRPRPGDGPLDMACEDTSRFPLS